MLAGNKKRRQRNNSAFFVGSAEQQRQLDYELEKQSALASNFLVDRNQKESS